MKRPVIPPPLRTDRLNGARGRNLSSPAKASKQTTPPRACPGDSGGGCFISTAAVEYAGLPDNCRQLAVLRTFRDTWVNLEPSRAEIVDRYYEVAPAIVARLKRSADSQQELAFLYRRVEEAVALIDRGLNENAFQIFNAELKRLEAKFT